MDGAGGSGTVGDVVGQRLLGMLEQAEEQLDNQLHELDKIDRVEAPRRRQTVQVEFKSPPRSGEDVISLRNVHKGYGTQAHLAALTVHGATPLHRRTFAPVAKVL